MRSTTEELGVELGGMHGSRDGLKAVLLRDSFRQAMAALPGGVSVVTTVDPYAGEAVGITASAVCSVSLRPPKMLVCVDVRSRSHRAFISAEHLAVNVLHAGQADIARRFAVSGGDKFAGLEVLASSKYGIPVLADAAAVLECHSDVIVSAGDHSIVIADVHNASQRMVAPLVYVNRAFARPVGLDEGVGSK